MDLAACSTVNDIAGQHGQTVHVVVTCTNRKRGVAPEHLRVRSLGTGSVDVRCEEWVQRLSAASAARPASDMYAGEHWLIARGLAEIAGEDATLWVCSAGYGLIRVDARIAPYAATFAAGHEDSVAPDMAGARRWWEQLAAWDGLQAGQPRSFTALARRDPDAAIVAVLSEPYLRACATDLRDAAKALTSEDSLSIIGPGGRSSEVDEFVIPVTAALTPVLGGSLLSLNARAAAHVLEAGRASGEPVSRSMLAKLMADATAGAPQTAPKAPGIRMADEEVRAFIRKHLVYGPTSATALLRELRRSGRSCEQARFRELFLAEARSGGWR
ncbi:hypothetical protein Pth03_11610 [Planotetraspora thailandica]|uniref:Uncharacterized protein n=1 Tax=Planotetraspora thailandica TaxID=487172 RepID=A0A8J3UWM2_9ACTN|nr:hypothetical protein Pth03_11610 [Planotetraspora thailandica]